MNESGAGTRRPRVAILGAGVGGLTAADALRRLAEEQRLEVEILVFDGAERAGGCAGTEVHEGTRLERGPDTLVTHKPAGLALCERLGLGSRLEFPATGAIEVWHRGGLLPVPEGFALLAPMRRRPLLSSPLLSWTGRLRAWCEPLVPPRNAAGGDESVAAFVRRRFGAELYRRITEPLVGSISMSDVETLSMAATFPRFAALERQPGRISGRRAGSPARPPGPALAALAGGMGELVDALVGRLPARSLQLGRRVLAVSRTVDGLTVSFDGAPPIVADAVVVATPAPAAAALLATLDGTLAERIGTTRYASCATVVLAWPENALRNAPRSHGFFVPRTAGLPFVAAGFVQAKFPERVPKGLFVVRAFCGGALHPAVAARPDGELVSEVTAAMRPLVGAESAPAWVRVYRHSATMPQVTVGHLERMAAVVERAKRHPRLALAGGPLGAYGLPDVIAGGESAAAAVFAALYPRQ